MVVAVSSLLLVSTLRSEEVRMDPRVLYILDATGSMADPLGGEAKLQVAKRVFGGLLMDTPSNASIGLVAIGAKRQSCTDVKMSVPLTMGGRDAVAREVAGFVALGTTPLARSIAVAGDYLIRNKLDATIVLVTDGEEECNGDPLEEAKRLRKSGLDIVLHVVGFSSDAKARKQLEKIAQMGGGTFYDAQDEQSLKDALHDASGRATRYLRLYSSSEQTIYSKALHPIRDGETLDIQFRPPGPTCKKGTTASGSRSAKARSRSRKKPAGGRSSSYPPKAISSSHGPRRPACTRVPGTRSASSRTARPTMSF
jgi:Mg-chelatase subunit ChlD